MNKRVLAVTASAFALAAMPVFGVFAEDTKTVTDTVEITIDPSCTLGTSSAGKSVQETVANGNTNDTMEGSQFSVSCNDDSGWNITAVAVAQNEGKAGDLTAEGGTLTIPTDEAFSGSKSGWAFKLTGEKVEEGYKNWAKVPTSATVVAKDTTVASKESISVNYGVGISATQAAGTYSGQVTYTLATGPGGA